MHVALSAQCERRLARRPALIRQYVVEVMIPVVVGVLLAVPLAYALTVILINVLRTSYLELELSAMLDRRVVLFLGAIVLVVTVATCLMHLFSVRRQRSLADALRTTARTTTGRYGQMRRIMVVTQIACAWCLSGSAARFVRTLHNYYQVDPGFAVDSALAAQLLPVPGTPSTADASYYDDLLSRRLEAIPGVRSASVANWIPLGSSFKDKVLRVPAATNDVPASAAIWSVSDRFFDSMGIQLKEGSLFRRTIRPSGSPINMAAGRDHSPDSSWQYNAAPAARRVVEDIRQF